ncbi:MAG: SoxR reducing system RseC family protein [Gammaproteobacteria bacterium]
MILERARVERVTAPYAWVRCESQVGCQRCAEGKGCGGGIFSGLLRGRLSLVKAVFHESPRVGDVVMIGIEESALLIAALLLYMVPLAGLFIGAWLALSVVSSGDELAVFSGGVTGFMVSWVVIRQAARNHGWAKRFQPVVVQTLAEKEPCLFDYDEKQ